MGSGGRNLGEPTVALHPNFFLRSEAGNHPQRARPIWLLWLQRSEGHSSFSVFPRRLAGEGSPWQHSRTTCCRNQALAKNDPLASFQQPVRRVPGEVAGPGWKLDPGGLPG